SFGIGTRTRLHFYSQHVRQDNIPDAGVPTVGLPGFYNADPTINAAARASTKNYYGGINDYEKINADMVTARIEHDLSGGTMIRNTTRYGKSGMDRLLYGINAPSLAGGRIVIART